MNVWEHKRRNLIFLICGWLILKNAGKYVIHFPRNRDDNETVLCNKLFYNLVVQHVRITCYKIIPFGIVVTRSYNILN